GVSAFENCVSLAYVDLTALRNTGIRAFRGCTALRTVTLTENTKLSKEMFAQSGLVSADIYETVEIPAFCFAQCENLERVTLHNNLIVIGEGAFCQNPALTRFEFGTFRVESIGAQAFYECTELASFTLPDCAVSIGEYALRNCSSLTTLAFGANTELKNLGGALFSGTAIETFTVPAENERYAVSDDGRLLLNAAKDTVLVAATGYDFGEYTLAGYQTVGSSAFSGAKITKLTISDSRTVLSDYAFAWCTELTEVVFPAEEGVLVGAHAFDNSSALVTLTNLNSVKSVGDYAFARTGVKNVTIGANAVYGEGAFFQSALVTVTVGANARFGLGAFQSCTSLSTVNMPEEGGVHFGPVCFAYDTALINVDLSKTDNTIDREAFFGCTALQEARLANVEYLGDYAFAECASLTIVTLPKVVEIGEGAFAKVSESGNAAAISSVVLPSTLRKIGAGAFLGCFYLTEIVLPDSLEELGSQVFALCSNLESVTLPASITEIGEESFLGCEALTSINLGGIQKIGDFAFYSALALENVDLSSVTTVGQYAFFEAPVAGEHRLYNLTQIGDYGFFGSSITGMTALNLETVGYAAFMGNRSLSEFVFGEKIGKVDTLAFNRCTSLETFAYMKDGVKTYEGGINAYARLIDGVLYTVTPEGKLMLTSVPGAKNVETLTVEEGTELIGLAAGNGNTNVTKIVLPDSMKLIENFAFYGYTSLTAVEFRSSVAPVLDTVYATPFNLYQLDSAYYNLCVYTTSGYALVGVEEGDPGYELVHNQFDLFGYELVYYTFIGLAGKYPPVRMILPSNSELSGYDGTVYRAYFGEVANAERSDYVAREKNLIDFIAYAEEIAGLDAITTSHEALVNKALIAMNALKQSGTDFGYTEEAWNALKETVTQAKAEIFALKIANSRKEVRDLQAIISGLPTVYTKDVYDLMKEVETRLAALKEDEREIMDLSNYEALVASYNGSPNPGRPDSESQSGLPAWAIAVIVVGCAAVAGGAVAAVLLVKKKRANVPSQNEEGEDKEIK
ncbi:MAG: leucine-rich repeat protein, partial [Candidatus Gallimonas sp.]